MIPHIHDFVELVLVAEGHTTHRLMLPDGSSFSYGLIQGDCFAIMPGMPHAYEDSHSLVLYNIAFSPDLLKKEETDLLELPVWQKLFNSQEPSGITRLHLMPYDRKHIERNIQNIMVEFSSRSPGYRLRCKLALLEVICSIDKANETQLNDQDMIYSSGILKTLQYMEKNIQEVFDLKKMAARANMSVSNYTKKFRDMVGDSPNEYFIGLKLDWIRHELVNSDTSISELAFKFGFYDNSYLTKQFKRRHGITPNQYRNIARRLNEHE